MTGTAARVQEGLLERESELARGGELLNDARETRGRLLAVEGPAGIGKTVLLGALCGVAEGRGFVVLRARGGELEREFAHGVVRQLFEAHLRECEPEARGDLLGGAAGLAAPVVAPEEATVPTGAPAADLSFAVAHGLYWLTANLAEQRPVMLAIDDVQWADTASLRFLLHLARRLDGVAVLVVVCVRTGEPEGTQRLLSQLTSESAADLLRLAPLSEAGVAEIIKARLGKDPHPQFAAACQRATGGAPFLVGELASTLQERGIRPVREAASEVADIGPQAVARATLLRLGRLPASAAELARAVAVLGADGQLHRAARLAGVDAEEAVKAADALEEMGILHPGRPLEFVHPIVRSAVYDDIPAAARAAAHARAADLLADEDAAIGAIAAHLLLTEPEGRGDTVERLRAAAEQALARGASESAATYLQRALDEGGLDSEHRAALMHELGGAEKLIRPPAAMERLAEARDLARDPVRRARIAYDLAALLLYAHWEEATALVDSAIAEVEDVDRELAVLLEAQRVQQEFFDARRLAEFLARLPKLQTLLDAATPAGRAMALVLAGANAWFVQPPDEAKRLLELGLPRERVVVDEGLEPWLMGPLFHALVLTEDLERALQLADDVADEARKRGSRWGFGMAHANRAWVHVRRGDLVAAEADWRASLGPVAELGGFFSTAAYQYLVDALIERPDLDDEARQMLTSDVEPGIETTVAWPLRLEARGRVRLARGEVAAGIEDLSRCEETVHAQGNPNGWGWRPALALALAPTDRDRALELARFHLKLTHRVGLPRGIGIGLRTLGLVEGGDEGLAHLEEAVSVLEGSPARLEYARGLVELGAAYRRANQRATAREPLREGLDLAHRCGATRLAERARSELAATGARPRREMLTGRDALTATEQRIAGMAADGMSNPEIAQALFVTRKTVENHLGRIYPKLGINSRNQLPEALASGVS